MPILLLSWLTRRGLILGLLMGLLGVTCQTQASHIRAGDIQTRIDVSNPRRVFFRLTLYCREPVPNNVADQPTAPIFFGDGTCNQAVPRTGNILYAPDIRRYTFDFEHVYSGPGVYTASFIGENRNRGIRNMINSDAQSFYISTSVTIDPGLGANSSPILTKPPVDNAVQQQVFTHNPAAYDADGDSLAYELVASQQAGEANGVTNCTPVPTAVPGYVRPNRLTNSANGTQVAYVGPPVGIPGDTSIFQIDRFGTVTWNSPETNGEYNFAIKIKEYRRSALSGRVFYRLIAEIVRDIQVNVQASTNRLPTLVIPPDLCVVAGTPIVGNVTATDPDQNPVRLYANSGILPPATFTQSSSGPPTAAGTFRWTPDCSNIALSPTLVVFSAVDQPAAVSGVPLTDVKAWRITVIGPAPQGLQATVIPGTIQTVDLRWNSYLCRKAGAQIRIFRKENRSNWVPTACETGIPANVGYTQIAALTYTGTTDITTYTDTNGGAGLDRGKEYCYRIYVEFPLPAGGKSLASQEACVNFAGQALLMRNVTVDRTATSNGQITVRWTKPMRSGGYADPQQYRLSRAVVPSTTFTPVATINDVNTTTYVDADPALDTQTRSYSYRVELLSQNLVAETATAASSVRVEGTAFPSTTAGTQNAIALRWTYTVPWDNTRRPTTIYRRGPNANPNDPFVAIATASSTATGGTYRDEGTTAQRLIKGQTYCYYVATDGTYNSATLPDSLVNLSQRQCITVRNVPCAPVLTLRQPNCDSLASRLFDLPATPVSGPVYTNSLRWTLGTTPTDCSRAIQYYNLYYAPSSQDSLRFLTQVPATQTSYEHRNLPTEAGCYAVQAVDSSGTLSVRSNVACKSECQLFLLPNIFTPNGDGKNDTFRPKVFTPLRRTHFVVFNRWGVKIYESSADPLINWNGGGSRSEGSGSASVVEGMYYYQAEVEFNNAANSKRTYKGWVQITR